MISYRSLLAAAAAASSTLLMASSALGGVINPAASSFAVLSGGTLSMEQNVQIGGSAGAAYDVWLAQNVQIAGDVYTTRGFGIEQNATVSGRVVASGSVWAAQGAKVGSIHSGGNVGLDQGASSGGITAAGSVNIGKSAQVQGNLYGGGAVHLESKAQVHGSVNWKGSYYGQGATVTDGVSRIYSTPTPDTFLPSLRSAPSFSAGAGQTYMAKKTEKSFDPGSYGALNAERDTTIRLTAGTYNFSSIWLGQSAKIVADTTRGAVIINVASSLSADQKVAFDSLGQGLMVINVGQQAYLAQNVVAEASIFSFGSLSVAQNAAITGQLYSAGNMWLAQNVIVQGQGSFVPHGGGGTVPEPASAGLLMLGAALLLRRKR